MTTANNNNNNPTLMDRVEGFFKGTTKKPATTPLTSSLEHLHTSQHAQADAEAHHQASLMSGMPVGMTEGTQSLSTETIPQPMPRQVLNEVLGAKGHVPHAHHVDIDKVEAQHEQAVGPLGQVQKEPGLLDKAKQAIDSLTGKPIQTSSTLPIQHHPNIPHSALPDATLKQVQTAHGHPPHPQHVDVGTVEQRREQELGLGHVQQEPGLLQKVTNKLQDLVPPSTFPSTSTTTTTTTTITPSPIQTHPNIPHAAVTDQVLEDVQSQKGQVPHARHVDVDKVEQRHEQAVGPLGTVLKEPTLLDKVTSKIQGLVYPAATPTTTSTITINSHPNIPHSALSNQVLRDIQAQHGYVPHARHIDIKSIEKQREHMLGLGHVHGTPTILLDKAKLAIDNITGKSVAPLTTKPIQHHPFIPHSALTDATLKQLQNAHGHPFHARHVDIDAVERLQQQRMIEAVGPLGRVQKEPNLLEKMGNKIQQLVQPTTTSVSAQPPPTLLQDIETQKGHVPHAHHVDIKQVEAQHEQAVGPLGHVQEPTLLDKAKLAINKITGKSVAPLTTQPIQHHHAIPHSALSDATLKQIQNAHGRPFRARHVDIGAVERGQEQRLIEAIGPLGRVQKGPSLLQKLDNKISQATLPLSNAITAATITPPTQTARPYTNLETPPYASIPHAAVSDQVLRDVQYQQGHVPHARHVNIDQVEKRHEQAIGPLGHVQQQQPLQQPQQPGILEKMGDKLQDIINRPAPAAAFIPATTTTTTQPSYIPHAAVPDQVLHDVEAQKGKVPHAHHVDVGQVERRHDEAVGPLGHVQKEPSTIEQVGQRVQQMLYPTSTARTTGTTEPHANIPHAALPDQVLQDVQHQKGKVPHAHHVDIGQVEQRHEQAVGPLGHVQKEPTLMDKAKLAVGLGDAAAMARPTTTTTTTTPFDPHADIPHAAVPDQVLQDVQHQKGKVPHAHHVDIGQVEQRHDQAVGPLGHVQKEPTLLDKAKNAVGLGDTAASSTSRPVTTTTTATDQHPNIPHTALPDQVLADVQHQKGKVPHAHHVDVAKVEERHNEAVGPLGHVKEPTLMEKTKHALGMDKDKPSSTATATSTSTTPTRTEDIAASQRAAPTAGVVPAVAAVGAGVIPAGVIAIDRPVAQRTDLPSTSEPLVPLAPAAQRQPTLLDKMEYKIFGVEPIRAASTTGPTTGPATTSTTDQHPNIPHAAVPDQVLKDVQKQKGKVPHAHHVDVAKVEQQHNEAVGPLGHVQKEPTLMDKAKHALGIGGEKSKDKDKDKDATTTDTTKDKAPFPAHEPRPNIMSTNDIADTRASQAPLGTTTTATAAAGQPVDLNEAEMERSRRLALQESLGGTGTLTGTPGLVMEDKAQPNIMHNSLPTRVMNELKDQHGHVPHAHHVDINQVEKDRDRRLSDSHMIGRVQGSGSSSSYAGSNAIGPTTTDLSNTAGLTEPRSRGSSVPSSSSSSSSASINPASVNPSLPGSTTIANTLDRSNSGFTAGGFPSSTSSNTDSNTLPSTTAYFKDVGPSSSTTTTTGSNLSGSNLSSGSNLPASSLTSDLGYKSGLIGSGSSSTSSSKSTGHTPLVATLPPGSNLESASGVRFEPADTQSQSSTNLAGPRFHPQK